MESTADRIESIAEARFTALLDAAVDAMLVIDSKGQIEIFNKAAELMFGYKAADVAGQNVDILMPEPYRSEHSGYINRYLTTGQKRIIGIGREVKGRRQSGDVFPLDLSVGAIEHEGEQKFVGIIRDITDRKQTEMMLRQQQERLEHVMRLGTLGEMAAGIAHEINQPLTAIATYMHAATRLINSGRMEGARLVEILEKTATQAERAGQIIRHVRSLARKQPTKRELHNVPSIVREALRLAEVDSRLYDVTLEFDSSKPVPEAWLDSIQIQQVILNLIHNAMETEPPARLIRISIFSDDPEEVIIEVRDDGPGISKEMQSEIFNPFVTTKSHGTGMGLSISRSILASHGGRLIARNNKTGGATFRLLLPTAVTAADHADE